MISKSSLNFITMKLLTKSKTFIVTFIIFLLISCFVPISLPQKIDQSYKTSAITNDYQILYAPMWGFSTYLMDNTGALNHTWQSNYLPGIMVRWLGDGSILRTIRIDTGPGSGGAGGGVQKVLWDGTVVWDFRYNTDGHLSHHDIQVLPNGNVLMIAWENKSKTEAIAAGRNPDSAPISGIWPDHVIEVQPTGPTSGNIVWEWHVWDHLIQDYDSSKANYGVVGDHPELVDINFGGMAYDWLHTNSIDYNEKYDQILLSVYSFNEIWVIDHSTTTEEAAGHTSGNSGKGGDILYRWGNPQAYRAGTASDQKFFLQHDATWIEEGYPGSGDILVFNNGKSRPDGLYSTIDEITPPVNDTGAYYLEPGLPYGPENLTWRYIGDPPTSFFAFHLSGAYRLPTGNTLITHGQFGKIFEVTPEGETVWEYNTGSQLFKVEVICSEEPPGPDVPNLDCSGSLSWTNVKPGATVNGSFQLQNIGGPNSTLDWTVKTSLITWGTWTFTPESGENLTPGDGQVTVQVSVVAPNEKNTEFQGYIRVENINDPTDFELIPIFLKTPVKIIPTLVIYLNQFLLHFFQNHPLLEKLLHHLIS
jgi:hypothetical protein